MTEKEFFEAMVREDTDEERFAVALEFAVNGQAESVEALQALREELEKGIVPQFEGDPDDFEAYDAWGEKNEKQIESAIGKVHRLLRKQGKHFADKDDISIDELEKVYKICFDDVLHAMCNGPWDDKEARKWVRKAFETGVAINAYAGKDGILQ